MKKVIYTCLTGGYDRLLQPLAVDPSFDYVCFTETDGQDGVWQLRKLPEGVGEDNLTRSRHPKLQPHEFLPEYGTSVYMDANLQIVDDEFYRMVDSAIDKGNALAMLPHPWRDCVWEELRYCYLKDKLSTREAVRHHRHLKETLMPRHWGLWENNVILRAHNEPEIVALDNLWWRSFNACRTRDQLTFAPSLYRLGTARPVLLFGEGLCARNVPFINYSNHPATGKENTPGRLTRGNIRYRLRLCRRKLVLLLGLV